jgi:hypothetical protein
MRFLKWLLHNPHETEEEDPFLRAIARIESLISKLLSILMIGLIVVAVVDLARFLVADLLMEPTGFFSTTLIEIFGPLFKYFDCAGNSREHHRLLAKASGTGGAGDRHLFDRGGPQDHHFRFREAGGVGAHWLGGSDVGPLGELLAGAASQASIQVRGKLG